MIGTIKVTGFKELEENLRKLPQELAGKILREALKSAAEPMTEQWKQNAPRSDEPTSAGHAADSIKTRSKDVSAESDSDVEVQLWIGPDRKHFYLMFTEFGTIHIAARGDGRQAFDAQKDHVIDKFGEDLGKKMESKATQLYRANR